MYAHRIFSRSGFDGARDVGKPCFSVIVFFFADCARWGSSVAKSMRTLFLEDTHFPQLTGRGAVSIRCEGGVRLCVRPAWSLGRLIFQSFTPTPLPPSPESPWMRRLQAMRENALTIIIAALCVYDAVIIWLLLAG